MTREEAIKTFEEILQLSPTLDETGCSVTEAMKVALSALRPVSREQVERMKGVWIFNDDWWEFQCSECHKGIGNIEKYKFCPHCGAPMTDEAVEMVMERLEALNDGSTTN